MRLIPETSCTWIVVRTTMPIALAKNYPDWEVHLMNRGISVGIDAANLGSGGATTHLRELLGAVSPSKHGISRVVVWGAAKTLDLIEYRPWLVKQSPRSINGGLLKRSVWQRLFLSDVARLEKCDVLFVPGGSYAGTFHPIVTMSRNMLPFEWNEIKRYGVTYDALKLLLRRRVQSGSFQYADGVIFLTQYAKDAVHAVIGDLGGEVAVVPHGLNDRFKKAPRLQQAITAYSQESPYKIIYVSTVSEYKHQWQVVEAVGRLRETSGWPLQLHLVGSGSSRPLRRLHAAMHRWDSKGVWVNYHGVLPHDQIHSLYQSADLGVFASSCENMPNILIETMAAGLPIACSKRGPMPEVLGDAGIYFNPEKPNDITEALHQLISSPELRTEMAERSYKEVHQYSWERCADSTFRFLAEIAGATRKKDSQF